MGEASVDKREWRRLLRERRRAVDAAARGLLGERMAAHFFSVPELAAARTVLLYAATAAEAPTEPLARRRGPPAGRSACPASSPAGPGKWRRCRSWTGRPSCPGPFKASSSRRLSGPRSIPSGWTQSSFPDLALTGPGGGSGRAAG